MREKNLKLNLETISNLSDMTLCYLVVTSYLTANKEENEEEYKVSIPNNEIRNSLEKFKKDLERTTVKNLFVHYNTIMEKVSNFYNVNDKSMPEAFDDIMARGNRYEID